MYQAARPGQTGAVSAGSPGHPARASSVSRSRVRRSISCVTHRARSLSIWTSSADQARGSWSTTQNAPSGCPLDFERNPGIRDHRQFPRRRVVPEHRVLGRVRNHQRRAPRDGVLAERMRQRRLAQRLPRLGQPERAHEELPVAVDQRHQRDGHLADARGQAREAVERPLQAGCRAGPCAASAARRFMLWTRSSSSDTAVPFRNARARGQRELYRPRRCARPAQRAIRRPAVPASCRRRAK